MCYLSIDCMFFCLLFFSISGCEDSEYDCEDQTCINKHLKCNGRNNCRFLWDEDDCHVSDFQL